MKKERPLGIYVLGFVALIVATILVLWVTEAGAQETLCYDEAGAPGFLAGERCWTEDAYNEAFATEALEAVPSLAFPGRSVADVYDLGRAVDSLPEPADRAREFMGQIEPSFAELIERAEEAYDNPAFAS